MSENESTICKIWDAIKAVLRGNVITTNTCIRREERIQISNLILHLNELEKNKETSKLAERRKQ